MLVCAKCGADDFGLEILEHSELHNIMLTCKKCFQVSYDFDEELIIIKYPDITRRGIQEFRE